MIDIYPAIKTVAYAMSRDASRPNINTISVEQSGEVVATDGHRMAIVRGEPVSESILLPALIVDLILAAKSPTYVENNGALTIRGVAAIHLLRSSVSFPSWRVVIPRRSSTRDTRPRKQWLSDMVEVSDPDGVVSLVIDALTIRVNGRYLRQALKSIGSTTVQVTISVGAEEPIMLTSVDEKITAVVMPSCAR